MVIFFYCQFNIDPTWQAIANVKGHEQLSFSSAFCKVFSCWTGFYGKELNERKDLSRELPEPRLNGSLRPSESVQKINQTLSEEHLLSYLAPVVSSASFEPSSESSAVHIGYQPSSSSSTSRVPRRTRSPNRLSDTTHRIAENEKSCENEFSLESDECPSSSHPVQAGDVYVVQSESSLPRSIHQTMPENSDTSQSSQEPVQPELTHSVFSRMLHESSREDDDEDDARRTRRQRGSHRRMRTY